MIADEMDESGRGETSFARTRQRKLRLWHIGVGLLCLAVAGLLIMRWHWRYEFHRRIEAIRAAGFPVTWQELDAWYAWPATGQNAADWVLGAEDCCQKLPPEDSRRLEQFISRGSEGSGPTEPLPDDLKALLQQHIGNNAQALALLHEVAAVAEGRYPVDLSKGPAASLSHITSVRDSIVLLCLEAAECAEHQDPNGAARAIEATLAVARSVDKEPMLISHSVRMWGSVWAGWALERALRQVEFTEGQLVRLHGMFGGIQEGDGLRRALVGNRCVWLSAFEKPTSLHPQTFDRMPPLPVLEVYDALGLSAREGALFLDYAEECLRIAGLSAFQRQDAIKRVEARYLRRRDTLLLSRVGLMSGQMRQEARVVAWLEVTATALAVERYRLGRERLPDALGQLVPDYLAVVPEDPFDGMPLRYRRMERGFVVYSVGENGQDDGGKDAPLAARRKSAAHAYDITFTVER